MPQGALLGLLGAAMLAAVSSVPVDSGNNSEEMVTRCIIEVLSNALSKSSVPPITPECQQVLQDSGQKVSDEEKSENENTKFEVRLLRDPVAASVPHWTSGGGEAGAPGKDTQSQTKSDTEKWAEGGGHSQEGAGEAQESLYPCNTQVCRETKTRHSEMSKGEERKEEERGNYPEEHREDAKEENHLEPGEKQNSLLRERNQAVATKKEEPLARADSQSSGRSVERTHSKELSSQESGEEQRSQGKRPQELSNDATSQEEAMESEEDTASELVKRRMRPRHHHGRSRPDRFAQEGSPPSDGRGQALEELKETDVGKVSLGEKRDHRPSHHRASEEERDSGKEGRSHPVFQAPKNLNGVWYGGRGGGEEDLASRLLSEDSPEDKRNHHSSERENLVNRYSEDSEEERGSEESKRFRHRGKAGEPDAYSPDAKEEKRFLGEGHYHVQESQLDKARRHPQSKWHAQERNYLNYGDEGVHGKWQLGDPKENREDGTFQDKQYNPSLTTEKRKRLGVLFNPYFDPLQWKNSKLERKANMDDSFLVGEDENGLTLNDKNFFPEYNYDLWERKPFSEDVNWGYEKRSFPTDPKLDLKRQYDRVAELDQLLHYRKKSAEFPDFYDAEEQMEPRRETENEGDQTDQRVLTEEEEKELENLAVMDLELQKIAEKFSQRG